ncbi:MAG TPA: M23 family metallopeptidase, partial [Anaerolineales bacterium]|nr:M23 family metallopeptidase [Anaerolineales bacterium]
ILMKRILNTLLFLSLAACTSNFEAVATQVIVDTKVTPTNTPFLPVPDTPIPTSAPTSTPEVPCDPFTADFCITAGHFILQRPIDSVGNDQIDTTYRYGSTANGTREPHHGVEFPNESGTPVYAAARGIVVFAGPDKEAVYCPWENFYGNLIVIQHDDGLFTLYAHLSKIDVQAGQEVFTTDKIGEVGRTGVAIGSHLHFEVRQGDGEDYFATRNPELWLIPINDGNGIPLGALEISVVDQDHTLVKYAELTTRYYLDRSQRHVKSYYGTTYAPELLNGEESAAFGELPAGDYRVAVKANDKVYERWVEVKSGELTQVVFVVK